MSRTYLESRRVRVMLDIVSQTTHRNRGRYHSTDVSFRGPMRLSQLLIAAARVSSRSYHVGAANGRALRQESTPPKPERIEAIDYGGGWLLR